MRPRFNAPAGPRRQLALRLVAVLAATGLLAACASTSADGTRTRPRLFSGPDPNRAVVTVEQNQYGPEFFLESGYCPPVEIRPGAEAFVSYERGHEQDPDYIRYQASITKTARECHATAADTLQIKVGVAGQVVAGPKGGAGTVQVPLQVVVVKQHGETVFFNTTVKVAATLAAPSFRTEFSQVFDQVVFKVAPEDRDHVVYVGFNQGGTPSG